MAEKNGNGPAWLYQDDNYKGKAFAFPSDDIDPELKKEKAWCMGWAKAIYAKLLNDQAYLSIDKIRRIELLRLYALGDQPRDKYIDWLVGDINQNPMREGYYNLDSEIFSPMPAYLRKVMGRLESQDQKLSVTAIDPLSGTEKENLMWDSWFDLEFGAIEELIRLNAQIPKESNDVKYVPQSKEELEAFNQVGGFKLRHEIDMEKGLAYTDYVSDLKEVRKKFLFDLCAINAGAYRDFVDIDGVVKYEYLDFARLVINGTRETGFKDSRFWGYMRFETITNVRAKTGLKEDELINLCRMYQGYFGNPTFSAESGNSALYTNAYDRVTGTYNYDNYLVPVFECEMKSVDTEYKTKRKTKYGTTMYGTSKYGEVYNTPTKKTSTVTLPQVYRCHWIVGTEYAYDYGQQFDIPRFGNKRIPALSCHAYQLPGKSMVEQCQGALDQIHLAYLKLQNALASAAPNGLAIEVGALNNINLGDGDKKPLDLISLRMATGSMVYKATTHAGKVNQFQGKPIERIEGGIGSLFEEIIRTFELNFNFIAELSGIDRFSAVAAKPGETTATEINQIASSASDAIQPIYSGWLYARESGARNALEKIRLQIKYKNGYDVYYPILGNATIENFRISREASDRVYGLKIEALPSQNYQQIMLQAAQEALKPGRDGEKLTYPDYLLIVDMIMKGMLRQARMILSYRIEVQRQEALRLQRENVELQGEQGAKMEREKRISESQRAKEAMMLEAVKAFLKNEVTANSQLATLKEKVLLTLLEPLVSGGQGQPGQPGEGAQGMPQGMEELGAMMGGNQSEPEM